MSKENDDDSRLDNEGNVYEKNWAGNYEQKWDMWNQQVAQDNSERENKPDLYSWDGTPLYKRRNTSSNSSDSGGDLGSGFAAAGVYLIIMGVIAAIKVFREPSTSVFPSDKSPILAGLLSFFFVGGAGHIYLGQKKKGTALILLTLFLIGPVGMTIGAIDAYGIANKLRNGQTVKEWEFGLGIEAKNAYIALAIIALIALVTIAGDYIFNSIR